MSDYAGKKQKRWKWLELLLNLHGIGGYLFLYLPILILVVYSFNASRYAGGAWRGFTLDWYKSLFANEALGAALRNSLIVAGGSTLASTVFGTMVALAMERYKFRGKLVFDGVLYLPIIMPGILGGALLAFTLSIDDFVITFFTSGPGSTTLPLRIYSMVKLGITPEINALSCMMLLFSMLLVFSSLMLQRGGEGGATEIV